MNLARKNLAPMQTQIPVQKLCGGEDDRLGETEDQILDDETSKERDTLQKCCPKKEALDPGQAVTEGGSNHLGGE